MNRLVSSVAEREGERQRFRGSCGCQRVEQAGGDCFGMGLELMGMMFDGCWKQTFVESAKVSRPGQTLACAPSD